MRRVAAAALSAVPGVPATTAGGAASRFGPAPVVRAAAPAPTPAGREAAPATPPASRPAPTPAPAPASEPAEAAPAAPPTAAPEEPGGDGPAYVTPLVRKLASEHGIDLAQVRGTGVGGRVRKQDVLEAARARQEAQRAAAQQVQAGPGPAPAETAPLPSGPRPAPAGVSPLRGRTEKMSRLRRVIAARMVESLQISAQLTTVVEVDVTNVARLRDRAKEGFLAREGVRLTFLPFFAKAAVEALKSHPSVNASIDTERGEITYHDAEHLGVAVDTERGLLVPVVRDAGDLNLAGLARKINDLAERTRSSQITPDELSGGTFTVTNTGSRGALFDTPIINQPQVAILGTGAVVKRPVVVAHPELGETIAIRSVAYLALTYDHRLVDGADAARFLTTVKNRLEEGDFAAELGL